MCITPRILVLENSTLPQALSIQIFLIEILVLAVRVIVGIILVSPRTRISAVLDQVPRQLLVDLAGDLVGGVAAVVGDVETLGSFPSEVPNHLKVIVLNGYVHRGQASESIRRGRVSPQAYQVTDQAQVTDGRRYVKARFA